MRKAFSGVFSLLITRLDLTSPPLPPFLATISGLALARTVFSITFHAVIIRLVTPTNLFAAIPNAIAKVEVPSELKVLLVGVRAKYGGSGVMNEAHGDAVYVEDHGEVLT